VAEIQGTPHAEISPPREDTHLRRPEMTKIAGKTAGLGETTLFAGMICPGRPKEEETARLSTPLAGSFAGGGSTNNA